MSKIVIIGIDGLDPFLIEKWKEFLPNMKKLCKKNSGISIESTTPPDSICAWVSIFTNQNPAEHGLIESIDYLAGKKAEEKVDRSADFKGMTFWDIASKKGKSVCIINPFLAYPAWEVNGVMVSGPVFEGGSTSTYPRNILDKYEFPPLGGMVDFPNKNELGEFLERTKRFTDQLADVSLKMYKDYSPDLFFVTFLTLDRVKHFFWRFTDKDDNDYPGKNPFENAIKDFYVIFDKVIGDILSALAEDTSLLIISDHGHGRRCSYCLNLNELLRKSGYLKTSDDGAGGFLKMFVEKLKVLTLSTLSKYNLQDWIYKIAKFIPNRKSLKKSAYLIDKESSNVTLSNLCGANPHGGIDIDLKDPVEYEELRNSVINELNNINRSLGMDVVKWVKKREDVSEGQHVSRLPDIMFELNGEYGVGMDMFTELITPNYTHKKISGGHKNEAVLMLYSENKIAYEIGRPKSVVGISDYILKLINA